MKVRVTDPTHELFGQEVEGGIIYYDIHHRGGRPDLYQVKTPEGKTYRLLTDQIDAEYYYAQEIAREVERIGANVGDSVLIIEPRSNHSRLGFDWKAPHVITKIDPSGNVDFDNGMASCFRPVVQIVNN